MKLRIFSLLALLCLVSACANVNVPNPFVSAPPGGSGEVYYSQFSDIPIPVEMNTISKRSLISTLHDGSKVGLETFEGRVEPTALSSSMNRNMARQGWSLRGSASGKNIMQVHEKDQRFVVIYIYDQTISTGLEVWVMNRLSEGLGLSIPSGNSPLNPVYSSPAPPVVGTEIFSN